MAGAASSTSEGLTCMEVRSSARRLAACFATLLTLVATEAFAQNDLSGEWAGLLHEDINHRNDALGGGPRIGDYTGLPINDAARARADAWDAALWTLPEHQTIF